ncbi:MAG: hypothetical protein AUJ92_10100 [Armatimonadetes bacterium CG2_30_59_28]|nr:MAG: hypothetical protein AUJ92_10100 [Armatimonadetes bacterium CG2_30_59_28]PIU62532.1 MAG: creatininase [Armatimonadetes bacterium CG07_land_8_20_14_0_80_59_28]PIX44859.1 MAG: creatininase [Armatimonadetes bacterium CG_4_8_14_3_um_filter_58_9]PIY45931.1 MAG: creatininase [Armatimonadetes bacterium CG_4_10_14_3_um_filter_59_10]PJB72468.1 MAG: creatininase [Armatimonadetes bacterium CG_4_9_14_3_um_filter_58_7]
MREWKLAEARYNIVKERSYEVAVLPIGATEPHGLHLPYGTDSFEVESLANLACEKAHGMGAKVILLPTIPFSVNTNQMEFPLAINVNPSTLNSYLTDIIHSLEHHRIPKLILLNGHGGNNFQNLLRELVGRTRIFLTTVNGWQVADDVRNQLFIHPGDHADEMETSWMLHTHPELVHIKDCDDGATKTPLIKAMRDGWAWFPRPWHKVTKNTGVGDPREATADKGERFLTALANNLAEFIKDLSDAEMDEGFPY